MDDLQPDGVGALNLAYEQLKEKLSKEGLFAPERKKTLPRYPCGWELSPRLRERPSAILSMCSPGDFRLRQIILQPVQVQGADAPGQIADAIRLFRKEGGGCFDCWPGGGSLEELWAFNEEEVARAVAASEIPVVSAVGHETDFTICDFAADLRAPTPSAAAELCVPDAQGELARVQMLRHSVFQLVQRRMESEQQRLDTLSARAQLQSPIRLLDHRRQSLEALKSRLGQTVSALLLRQNTRLAPLMGKLDALSPLKVLSRGYAIAYHGRPPYLLCGRAFGWRSASSKMADGGSASALEVVPVINRTGKTQKNTPADIA